MADFVLKQEQGIFYGMFPRLEALNIVHAFTCRFRGCNSALPQELNMALHVGGEAGQIVNNRQKVAAALGFDYLKATTCKQVHGTNVVEVTPALVGRGALSFRDSIDDTDGLFTDLSGVPLMLFFADCVPVILVDRTGEYVALVHAGWRGSIGRIAAITVEKMVQRYGLRPSDLIAAIGPSIGPCCYEVDKAVYEAAPSFEHCFAPTGDGHWQLDLWSVNRDQLLAAGLLEENILGAELCTCHNSRFFYSFRAEKGKTGRMAAIVYKK